MARRYGRIGMAVLSVGLLIPSGRALAGPSSALELVRQAHAHEAERDDDVAASRYVQAISIDPTCGEAYVGLGNLRARLGDLQEADRVFSVALEHVPALGSAFAGRARVRRSLGARDDARQDMERAAIANQNVGDLRELAGWYGLDGLPVAQLAVWRRIYAVVRAGGDAAAKKEAATMVRALQIVVGPADPVSAPPVRTPFRALVAKLARKPM